MELVHKQATKTKLKTGKSGQQQISHELNALDYDWDQYTAQLTDTRQGLQEALTSWQDFDELHDSLSKWMREMEGQVKDYELKSTLSDKQTQLQKFRVRLFVCHF